MLTLIMMCVVNRVKDDEGKLGASQASVRRVSVTVKHQ